MCRVFLFFWRTCLCTQSREGCWLTANSNCPEAIGSHFQTGSFIFPWKRKWSLALILNHPPAAAYKVIREALWQTHSHTCMYAQNRLAWSHGQRRREQTGDGGKILSPSPGPPQVNLEQQLQFRVMVCVTVCGSSFKEEVRDSCGCGSELRGKPWPKKWRAKMRAEGRGGGQDRTEIERTPFYWGSQDRGRGWSCQKIKATPPHLLHN